MQLIGTGKQHNIGGQVINEEQQVACVTCKWKGKLKDTRTHTGVPVCPTCCISGVISGVEMDTPPDFAALARMGGEVGTCSCKCLGDCALREQKDTLELCTADELRDAYKLLAGKLELNK